MSESKCDNSMMEVVDPAVLYQEGLAKLKSGDTNNKEEGIKFLEEAARLNHAEAMNELASVYVRNIYAPRNIPLAMQYLEQAIRLQNRKAMYWFAMLLLEESGVDPYNPMAFMTRSSDTSARVIAFLARASALGHAASQKQLDTMILGYSNSKGVGKIALDLIWDLLIENQNMHHSILSFMQYYCPDIIYNKIVNSSFDIQTLNHFCSDTHAIGKILRLTKEYQKLLNYRNIVTLASYVRNTPALLEKRPSFFKVMGHKDLCGLIAEKCVGENLPSTPTITSIFS